MNSFLRWTSIRLVRFGAIGFIAMLLASTVSAQVIPRVVSGVMVGKWRLHDAAGVTPGGRTCPCDANPGFVIAPGVTLASGGAFYYPGVGAFYKPLRPGKQAGAATWTTVSAGSGVGDDIILALDNWNISTMSTLGTTPNGVVKKIVTNFAGGNTAGTLSAGAGPAAGIFAPLSVTIPAVSLLTNMGEFEPWPAFPARVPGALSWNIVTGGGFGGELRIHQIATNELKLLDLAHGGDITRENGSYGGLPVGVAGVVLHSARRYINTVFPPADKHVEYHRWWGTGWTTGMVSAASRLGQISSTWARTGQDTIVSGFRQVSLVTPILNATPIGLTSGGPGGQTQAWLWEMNFVPEPASSAGMVSGLAMLAMLYRRRRRSI